MRPEQVPPGFWRWAGEQSAPVDGVELESSVATRFFQTVDPCPPEWGDLSWRIQLNKFVSGRADLPMFRTFYPGIEWNLSHPDDDRWFLTAWCKWEGPGPAYRDLCFPTPVQIQGDVVFFRIAWLPKAKPPDSPRSAAEPDFDKPLFLRSRVDARDRRRIAEDLQSKPEVEHERDPSVIMLDDIIDLSK